MLFSFSRRAVVAPRSGQVRLISISGIGSALRDLTTAMSSREGTSPRDGADLKTISVARLTGVTILAAAAWLPIAAATARFLS